MSDAAVKVNASERDAIESMLADYCHCLDDAQWDDWPAYFTKDGVYKILTRDNHEAAMPLGVMYCDGRGMMQDRMLALQTANVFEPHTYCHTISRPRLDVDAASQSIRGRTNFNVIRTMQSGGMEIFAAGKYLDHFALNGEQVLLRERLVILESRRVDILLVAPL